ncbi:MAG: hypothetical protein P4L85_16650 [Paludisphaera borealis]|uniref:hypothetical protein n=1 Tax=Paludisphaera borealis TaxID=1387353 RepID=UPI00283FD52B|nr:hypothetical protein [Paludisphaera borealis]MDR3620984.1 hypothetical protein [Paludisphaera borealis]
MKREDRLGGVRSLAGCVLGGVLGWAAALVIGVIDAPVVDPADPLEYEWYTPVALIVLPFCASIIGAILGALVGAAWRDVGPEGASRGAAGLFLGLAIGELLPSHGEGIQLLRHFFLTAAFTCGGLFFSSGRAKGRLLQCDETGDETASTTP